MDDDTRSIRLGLIWRYLVVVVMTSAIAAVVVAQQVAGELREQHLADLVERNDAVVQGTAASVLEPEELRSELSPARQRVLGALVVASLAEYGEGLSVVVADADGDVWLASPDDASLAPDSIERARIGGAVGEVVDASSEPTVVQTFPVRFDDREVGGFVQIRSTTEDLDATTAAAMRRLLVLTASILGAVQLLALPLLVQTARRLQRQHDQLEDSAREYEHLATHDQLTGLPNRVLFHDRVEVALADADRAGHRVVVAVVDLNDFKAINDTLGHATGDALLRAMGPRMAAALRAGDTVARFGGDEFVVLLTRAAADGDDAPRRALQRLLAAVREPVDVDGVELAVEASIGFAAYPDHGTTAPELLRRADLALYSAKEAHERVASYAQEMDRATVDHTTVLTDLRAALRRGDLSVAYQPILCLRTDVVVAHEALLRWQHPREGWIPPDIFVRAAERSGLIHELTAFVLDRGLGELSASGLADLGHYLSVNVSARDLIGDELSIVVRRVLAAHDLPGSALQLEVTETVAMADPVRAAATLGEIRELGVSVVIDDYGTGHSSLAYVQQLPVRSLKIDRTFVADVTGDEADRAIVRSTIDLAHHLGLTAVAEGVEDATTADLLRDMGCDLVQGYHYGRPGPLDASIVTDRPLLVAN